MNRTDERRLSFMRENRDKILAQTGLTGHQAVHFLASCGMNDLAEAFVGGAEKGGDDDPLFAPNPDHVEPPGMRRSIHRSHRGEGFNDGVGE